MRSNYFIHKFHLDNSKPADTLVFNDSKCSCFYGGTTDAMDYYSYSIARYSHNEGAIEFYGKSWAIPYRDIRTFLGKWILLLYSLRQDKVYREATSEK